MSEKPQKPKRREIKPTHAPRGIISAFFMPGMRAAVSRALNFTPTRNVKNPRKPVPTTPTGSKEK
jgi:hypothetical protein